MFFNYQVDENTYNDTRFLNNNLLHILIAHFDEIK